MDIPARPAILPPFIALPTTALPGDAALAAGLWRAGRPAHARAVLPTGHAALDALLADGGWPRGALSELLLPNGGPGHGVGELPLLQPALAAQVAAGGCVVLVSPPFLPCLAGWQAAGVPASRLLLLTPPDARSWLWSAEQAARTPGCSVLAWPPRRPAPGLRELRRLQLAAQQGNGLVVLLRDAAGAPQSSPAALRLALNAARGVLQVTVRKQRGGFGGGAVTLDPYPGALRTRLRPGQLPVHVSPPQADTALPPARADAPTRSPEAPHALAGHPLPATAAGPVDGRHGLH